jgi:hypothetical protein
MFLFRDAGGRGLPLEKHHPPELVFSRLIDVAFNTSWEIVYRESSQISYGCVSTARLSSCSLYWALRQDSRLFSADHSTVTIVLAKQGPHKTFTWVNELPAKLLTISYGIIRVTSIKYMRIPEVNSLVQTTCGLPFYYLKIGFLEYLRTSGEMRYPNGPTGCWKKLSIWKEGCTVHVVAVIHDYQGKGLGAKWSRKCQS